MTVNTHQREGWASSLFKRVVHSKNRRWHCIHSSTNCMGVEVVGSVLSMVYVFFGTSFFNGDTVGLKRSGSYSLRKTSELKTDLRLLFLR